MKLTVIALVLIAASTSFAQSGTQASPSCIDRLNASIVEVTMAADDLAAESFDARAVGEETDMTHALGGYASHLDYMIQDLTAKKALDVTEAATAASICENPSITEQSVIATIRQLTQTWLSQH